MRSWHWSRLKFVLEFYFSWKTKKTKLIWRYSEIEKSLFYFIDGQRERERGVECGEGEHVWRRFAPHVERATKRRTVVYNQRQQQQQHTRALVFIRLWQKNGEGVICLVSLLSAKAKWLKKREREKAFLWRVTKGRIHINIILLLSSLAAAAAVSFSSHFYTCSSNHGSLEEPWESLG